MDAALTLQYYPLGEVLASLQVTMHVIVAVTGTVGSHLNERYTVMNPNATYMEIRGI